MSLHDHILKNNPRFQKAAETADKSGAAYSGWTPKPRNRFLDLLLDFGLVAFAFVLVVLALKGLGK